jgi:protein TonB
MVKFTPPIIKKDEEVKEDEVPPPQKEVTASGPKTQQGDPDGIDPGIVEPTAGTGTGVVEAPPPPTVFNYVEQMPAAPYDVNSFLQKTMKYPDAARENNIEGRVIVKFVVNEDGKISDIQIARSLERSCDEEAKRVVASMPPWKPGKQNGKAVKVLFNLPIVFKLE